MKKKISLFILGVSLLTTPLFSQTLVFTMEELDPYFGEFVKPMAIGMATNLGAGWVHEAAPHKTLGFDISLSTTLVNFPSNALNFSTNALSSMSTSGYTFTEVLSDGSSTLNPVSSLPTLVSPDAANAEMNKTISTPMGNQTIVIPAFNGLDVPFAPGVSLQLAIGLPKGTEVIGRFVPEASSYINDYAGLDDLKVNKMNSWGIGVKHDIKQWIPVVSRIPILEISALVSYSAFVFDISSPTVGITPQTIEDASGFRIKDNSGASYGDQGFAMEMNSFTGSLLVGANIPVIHPFIGIGFNKTSASTGLTGTFPDLYVNNTPTSQDDVFYVGGTKDSPLNLDVERTFVNFQAGLNIKLPILTIHAQYTYQEYSMYSAGIALGFR